jgi:DNA-binding IclR family transcriptional regulator
MRSSDRLFDVLETLGRAEAMTLTQVAAHVDLPVPTVLRLLRALEERGWAGRLAGGEYTVGPQLIAAASQALQRDQLMSIAPDHLAALRSQLDETVSLSVVVGDQRVCLLEFESSQVLRFVHGRGTVAPLHAGASGKLLLAFSPPNLLTQVISGALPAFTEITPGAEALRAEVEVIRHQGWAMSFGELSKGGVALAVPVTNPHTSAVHALTVFAPEARFSEQAQEEWLSALRACAADIHDQLTPTEVPAR